MAEEVDGEEKTPTRDKESKKKRLIRFAADKCGLPISHISEVMPRNLSCIKISRMCRCNAILVPE